MALITVNTEDHEFTEITIDLNVTVGSLFESFTPGNLFDPNRATVAQLLQLMAARAVVNEKLGGHTNFEQLEAVESLRDEMTSYVLVATID